MYVETITQQFLVDDQSYLKFFEGSLSAKFENNYIKILF